MGSRRSMLVNSVPSALKYSPTARPSSIRAAPAKNRRWSVITGISSRITDASGLPTFSDSSRPISSACPSMASARASIMAWRSPGVVSNHVSSNALRAAATARSTSSSDARGVSAMVSPVAGFTTGRDSAVEPSTHSPPTNIRLVATATMAPPLWCGC